jgi:hypothetical protein
MKNCVFAATLVVFAAAASTAKADSINAVNLVVNGSFETGNFSGWTTTNLEWPYSRVTGWSDYLGKIKPEDGNYYASLSNDYTAGTIPGHGQIAEISQTIATTHGANYTLSFWLNIQTASNYVRSPGLQFQAYYDGRQLLNIQNPPVGDKGWVNYVYSVQGTGSDTITFFGANVPRYNGLDNVSLVDPPPTAAPLPGNLAMCGMAGMMGLGFWGFGRRRANWHVRSPRRADPSSARVGRMMKSVPLLFSSSDRLMSGVMTGRDVEKGLAMAGTHGLSAFEIDTVVGSFE